MGLVGLFVFFCQIVIILRGPPGSGKTHVARLIKVSLDFKSDLHFTKKNSNPYPNLKLTQYKRRVQCFLQVFDT